METLSLVTSWLTDQGAEIVGLVTLVALVLFAYTYARNADWRSTPPGRSVMWIALGLIATIVLLLIHSFVPRYSGRTLVEVAVYLPMAIAWWNMYFVLRATLGLKPPFVLLVPRKPKRSTLRKERP